MAQLSPDIHRWFYGCVLLLVNDKSFYNNAIQRTKV